MMLDPEPARPGGVRMHAGCHMELTLAWKDLRQVFDSGQQHCRTESADNGEIGDRQHARRSPLWPGQTCRWLHWADLGKVASM